MDYDLASEKQRITKGTEEIKKELLEKWKKRYANAQIFPSSLAGMNPELIKSLLSFQNTLFYNDLAKKFNLNQQQRDNLPRIVWYICLNKKWEQLKMSVINDLPINPAIADQIMSLLNQNIILKARELSTQRFTPQNNSVNLQKETAANQIISITANDAIKAYPELGEQMITSEKIQLKNFPEPVRPSIKNWLADYTFNLGYGKHDAIARGNYLFQNANTRQLNSQDRQKLALILKSFDENSMITINKETRQIVFPATKEDPQQFKSVPSAGNAAGMHQTFRFSSPQKLPYEKLKEPPKPLPKNVVNLRNN